MLLGPQRHKPTVEQVLRPLIEADARVSDAPVAAVTAGWQERETEVDELAAHLGREVTNLELYARAEDVFERDRELHDALQELHERLHTQQQLYRLRLRYLAPAAEELLLREGPVELLEPERESAFEQLRALDDHHLGRVAALRREFLETWSPTDRPVMAEHRREIGARLGESAALCVAGGHVRILLTRLWLFDIAGMLDVAGQFGHGRPIVSWSAGAMAMTERVVLFHDNPPQGKGWAEVLGPGLGVCPGVVALPDAARRLHLEESVRVQLLSRRFPDAVCAALDAETGLSWDGVECTAIAPTRQLLPGGGLGLVPEATVN